MAYRNKYRVNKRVWGRWSKLARTVFNDVYASMREDQERYTHSQAATVTKEHWNATAWNAAWTAAGAVHEMEHVFTAWAKGRRKAA